MPSTLLARAGMRRRPAPRRDRLDFTSALFLGLHHGSASLPPWAALTTGVPAALRRAAPRRGGSRRLAAGCTGADAGVVAPVRPCTRWSTCSAMLPRRGGRRRDRRGGVPARPAGRRRGPRPSGRRGATLPATTDAATRSLPAAVGGCRASPTAGARAAAGRPRSRELRELAREARRRAGRRRHAGHRRARRPGRPRTSATAAGTAALVRRCDHAASCWSSPRWRRRTARRSPWSTGDRPARSRRLRRHGPQPGAHQPALGRRPRGGRARRCATRPADAARAARLLGHVLRAARRAACSRPAGARPAVPGRERPVAGRAARPELLAAAARRRASARSSSSRAAGAARC